MTRKNKLLLLNPPSVQPVFRDCYCSGPSKGRFFIHPLDLQIQSGFFSQGEFQLEFIDAVYERLRPAETLEKIRLFEPDTVFSLVGEAFLEDDATFFYQLKSAFPRIRLFLSGDTARFTPEKLFRNISEADGLLMDFGSPGLLSYLEGGIYSGLRLRGENKKSENNSIKYFEYPHPWKGFAEKYSYQLPFFREPCYYSIAGSFGCPYNCIYCNAHLLGYRTRKIDDFIDELYFASALGFKSLYIRDATFMVDKERTFRLFDTWEKTGLRFQWICFTRPDLLDEELVARASRLGCCLMMLGVESFDENWLRNMSRSITLNRTMNTFRLLRKYGICSAAQMMIGVHRPQALSDYEEKLRQFLKKLDPDYVSLSVFFPRPGIEITNPAFADIEFNENLYKNLAARINRTFYFHPRTIARQLYLLRSPKRFALLFKIAAGLMIR